MGGQAPLPLKRQLLRALCPQLPPLQAGTVHEGGASVGVAPPGAAYARKRQPCPRAIATIGSSPGRREREENRRGRPKL
ncbi:hypothetical protein BHE74_00033841 [Ensete ventricosum]|nr:hypothetical protein BHE74_00033841 [Ensete ventricosum]